MNTRELHLVFNYYCTFKLKTRAARKATTWTMSTTGTTTRRTTMVSSCWAKPTSSRSHVTGWLATIRTCIRPTVSFLSGRWPLQWFRVGGVFFFPRIDFSHSFILFVFFSCYQAFFLLLAVFTGMLHILGCRGRRPAASKGNVERRLSNINSSQPLFNNARRPSATKIEMKNLQPSK